MSDPQVYVLESSDDGPFAPPPRVERQKEVLALWRRFCTSDPEHLGIFWWFIRALDAQHAERIRAEVEEIELKHTAYVDALQLISDARVRVTVEKMREAAILQIQAEAADTEDGETLESLNRVIERFTRPLEGTGQWTAAPLDIAALEAKLQTAIRHRESDISPRNVREILAAAPALFAAARERDALRNELSQIDGVHERAQLAEAENARLREALKDLAKPDWAYSPHNGKVSIRVVRDMQSIAKRALPISESNDRHE